MIPLVTGLTLTLCGSVCNDQVLEDCIDPTPRVWDRIDDNHIFTFMFSRRSSVRLMRLIPWREEKVTTPIGVSKRTVV
jgi:hypothetical protein